MRGFLLALALPGSPDGGFLLSDANQHNSVLAFASGDLQKRTRRFLLVLSFLEAHHRNVVSLGISIDGFYIGIPNLTKGWPRKGPGIFAANGEKYRLGPPSAVSAHKPARRCGRWNDT
jgi:hypothetical protein